MTCHRALAEGEEAHMDVRRVTRRQLLRQGLGAAASVGALSALPKTQVLGANGSRKPNIVLVFADQLRCSAVGCYGQEQVITPNIDMLASQGAMFTNAISGFPVCTPYRASLQTGRYCHSLGVAKNNIRVADTRNSLARVLKKYGYHTGYIGKWHLDGNSKNPPYVPPHRRLGYDYWVTNVHRHFDVNVCIGDEQEGCIMEGYLPDIQTDMAIDYINKHKDGPFFLCLSWMPPHTPNTPPEKHAKMYNPADIKLRPNVQSDCREYIAGYYGLVTSLDDNVGRLMKALEQASIADDTIFVFTSDHGDLLGAHQEGTALHKQRPWEESIHVPFVIRYPREIRVGSRTGVLINSPDVMPTLLGLVGAKVPSVVEGMDLSSFALGRGGNEPESAFLQLLQFSGGEPSEGLEPWRGVRTKRHTYARFRDRGWMLYDNKEDPYQLNNLTDRPEAKGTQDVLEAELQGWLKRTGDDFATAEEWAQRVKERVI